MPQKNEPTTLLKLLIDFEVEFIVVGGVAAVLQGVPTTTFDVDVVHRRTPENVARILLLLPEVKARVRGRPDGQVLVPGEEALLGPGHQLLSTSLGPLDLLGAIEQGLGYDDLLPSTQVMSLQGRQLNVLKLEKLAELKQDATHPKDRLTLLLIEETLKQRE